MILENKLEEIKRRNENVQRTIKILVKEISIYRQTGMEPEEIRQTILEEKEKRMQEYLPIAKRVMEIKIQFLAIQYLKLNKPFANRQLQKSKRKENTRKEPPLYDNDVRMAAKVVVREMIRGARNRATELTEEQFWKDLNVVEKNIEYHLKESYIQLLEKTGEFFACNGFLKDYKDTYNRFMKMARIRGAKV